MWTSTGEDDIKLKMDFAWSGLARSKAYLSRSSSVKEMSLSHEDASSASSMVVAKKCGLLASKCRMSA